MKQPARKTENATTHDPCADDVEADEAIERAGERPPHEWGCVHGRFQPFHNGHLEYVLRAKVRCRWLVVGITNPDPTKVRVEALSPHRHEPGANPFTYLERALMIRDALLAEGLRPQEFLTVPFPVHTPELLAHYAPADAVHFVRVYSDWEREKVRRLRDRGFVVEVLDPGREKDVSGAEVRRLMQAGLPWEHLLPYSAASVVRRALSSDSPRAR